MIKNDPYTKTTRQIPSKLHTRRKKKPRIQHQNTKTTQIQKQNNNPKHIKQRTTIQHQTKQIRKRSNRQHNRNIQRRPKIPTQTSNRRTNNPENITNISTTMNDVTAINLTNIRQKALQRKLFKDLMSGAIAQTDTTFSRN